MCLHLKPVNLLRDVPHLAFVDSTWEKHWRLTPCMAREMEKEGGDLSGSAAREHAIKKKKEVFDQGTAGVSLFSATTLLVPKTGEEASIHLTDTVPRIEKLRRHRGVLWAATTQLNSFPRPGRCSCKALNRFPLTCRRPSTGCMTKTQLSPIWINQLQTSLMVRCSRKKLRVSSSITKRSSTLSAIFGSR